MISLFFVVAQKGSNYIYAIAPSFSCIEDVTDWAKKTYYDSVIVAVEAITYKKKVELCNLGFVDFDFS